MPRPIRRSAVVLATTLLALGTILSAPAGAAVADRTDLAPQQFAPQQFAPQQFAPQQFAPQQFAPQRFAADSGDSCRYGVSEGTLEWFPVTAPPGLGSVSVTGTVADRPYERDPGPVCDNDGLYSYVTFYAYGNGRLITRAAEKVDNDILKFTFRLAPITPSIGVDTLVVQVCRDSLTGARPTGYCGVPQVYSSYWN
ncbi:hypothetical protein ACN28C_26470 [Plantactinospora sp. WMMC1484]|uniref:hypothetical protein n=1 Tax=Plantactinospora sp. WMMC1484 TaxID=3404122 RepID=UPI003BF56388